MAILTHACDDELREFIARFNLGTYRSSHGIEAGTVNTSYALDLGEQRYFLRLYEEQDGNGARAEAQLLHHLSRAGVPTPAPMPAIDGCIVHTLKGKPAVLFPWVNGDMVCTRSVTPHIGNNVGSALARMHLAGVPAESTLGRGRFGAEALLERCDRIASSSDADVEARSSVDALRRLLRDISQQRNDTLPSGLIHGDLFRDNVLLDNGQISALLDFESAHIGPYVYDIAVVLLAWSFGDDFDFSIGRAVLDGYRGVRELARVERDGLYAEALFGALRFTITRITDNTIRVGKRWQRFRARREALERLGAREFAKNLNL
jgi:homoserine kinase type II